MDNIEGITEFLKAIAHPKRIQILTLLLKESLDFSNLKFQTNLKKTALSNNLTLLIESKLIERYERGVYRITQDGKDLLDSITDFYTKSKVREIHNKKKIQRHYSQGWFKNMEKKIITNPATWESAWISYLGAVLGVLKSFGKEESLASVGGYTGYAFALPNVHTSATCPSGPTALGNDIWDIIVKSTELLGFKTKEFLDMGSFPSVEGDLKEHDIKRAKNLFTYVKNAIDKDKPVVLWGLVVPEYGICNGYTDDSYVVSTFRRNLDQPDTPIRYDALQAAGCLHAIVLEEELPPITEEEDKNTIHQAIKFAQGTALNDLYISGAEAFDKWAEILETNTPEDHSYHGNSYVAACTLEAEQLASFFLKQLSEKYEETPQATFLKRASEEYKNVATLVKEFSELFPFAFEGDMAQERRSNGAQILRSAKKPFINALKFLTQAYENWE